MSEREQLSHPILIADRLWWVGHLVEKDSFQCHAYLLENGNESVLFDPGSLITWEETRRKIEEIVPLASISTVVVHHQDPDIVASLPEFVRASGRDDLRLVTHWRAAALLKHMALPMTLWNVDEHEWTMRVGDRSLRFVATPYLHFAGAFCTFDERTGTLLSSDLCGGFSGGDSLFMESEDDIDGIEAFHEHYMPSREILMSGILELESLPLKRIAPQHGKIIPEEYVSLVFARLKNLDCGLFLIQNSSSGFEMMQIYSRIMKETMESLARERDFAASAKQLILGLMQVLPVDRVSFIVPWEGEERMLLTAENRYNGELAQEHGCHALLGMSSDQYRNSFGPDKYVLLPGEAAEFGLCNDCGHQGLTMPLFSAMDDDICGLAIIHTTGDVELKPELVDVLSRVSPALSVALEREMISRRLESERDRIFERSIRDPLTGLFTRRYMDDVGGRMISANDRDSTRQVALLMFDIDHFKRVNDTYGHQKGDDVLARFAQVLLDGAREADLPVRYGGEEFAFFAFVDTIEGAKAIADRFRRQVSDLEFEHEGTTFSVTVSVGVALHELGESLADTLRRSDLALYEAKETGRDRVCTSEGSLPTIMT